MRRPSPTSEWPNRQFLNILTVLIAEELWDIGAIYAEDL